jgi:hypothetical protein
MFVPTLSSQITLPTLSCDAHLQSGAKAGYPNTLLVFINLFYNFLFMTRKFREHDWNSDLGLLFIERDRNSHSLVLDYNLSLWSSCSNFVLIVFESKHLFPILASPSRIIEAKQHLIQGAPMKERRLSHRECLFFIVQHRNGCSRNREVDRV